MSSIWLYHYTDKKSADAICQSKVLYASTDTIKDAAFGIGVYFTDMDPGSHTEEKIAHNNWLSSVTSKIRNKLKYCIMVKFKRRKVEDHCEDGRRIYVYHGNCDLDQHPFKVVQCDFSSSSGISGTLLTGVGIAAGIGAILLLAMAR